MARALTLFIPGLSGPLPGLGAVPAGEWPPLPLWRRLLSRADAAPGLPSGQETALCALFDIPVAGDPPVAAITRVFDGGMPDEAWWLRADPVHLIADRDQLVLADPEPALSAAEAAVLGGELASHVAEYGFHLEVRTPGRWYLRAEPAPCLTTQSTRAAAGRDIHSLLPAGPHASQWRRLLNELQMILHACPVNEARMAQGLPAINSVWFWGGGRLPPAGPRPWDGVCADDLLSRALALHTGVACAPLPSAVGPWLSGLEGDDHLAVLENLVPAVNALDIGAWFAGLAALERHWLEPLVQGLRDGRLDRLYLVDDHGRGWALDRRALRRWWRRPRPLAAILTPE